MVPVLAHAFGIRRWWRSNGCRSNQGTPFSAMLMCILLLGGGAKPVGRHEAGSDSRGEVEEFLSVDASMMQILTKKFSDCSCIKLDVLVYL